MNRGMITKFVLSILLTLCSWGCGSQTVVEIPLPYVDANDFPRINEKHECRSGDEEIMFAGNDDYFTCTDTLNVTVAEQQITFEINNYKDRRRIVKHMYIVVFMPANRRSSFVEEWSNLLREYGWVINQDWRLGNLVKKWEIIGEYHSRIAIASFETVRFHDELQPCVILTIN
jgi:hypothetical protein